MAAPNGASSAQPATSSNTAPATSYRAAHAVLSINELLCDIVCHLPANDIVVATGVCRAWREALKGSPSVKEAMFLTPAPVRQNVKEPLTLDTCIANGKVHPSLARIFGNLYLLWPVYHSRGQLLNRHSTAPAKHPDGSWRDMFLTQPPCKYVFGSVWRSDPHDFVKFDFERKGGVKMGDLYDFLKKLLPKDQEPDALQITRWHPKMFEVRGGRLRQTELELFDPGQEYYETEESLLITRTFDSMNLITESVDDDDSEDESPRPPMTSAEVDELVQDLRNKGRKIVPQCEWVSKDNSGLLKTHSVGRWKSLEKPSARTPKDKSPKTGLMFAAVEGVATLKGT